MIYTYTAVLTPSPEENTVYAKVPDLSYCISSGKDMQDAILMITDALSGCLTVLEDEGVPIPRPSAQKEIPRNPDDVLTLVTVDTLAYRAKTDTRAVRKNVSLPAWMVKMADAQGINCSKVLQDALRTQLR